MFLLDAEFILLVRTADTERSEDHASRLDPDWIGEAAVHLLANGLLGQRPLSGRGDGSWLLAPDIFDSLSQLGYLVRT